MTFEPHQISLSDGGSKVTYATKNEAGDGLEMRLAKYAISQKENVVDGMAVDTHFLGSSLKNWLLAL